ncbi:MAG: CdaR family protein [Chloroflexota bacterium]
MRINSGLAALALLVSISLWVLVINDQNPERTDTTDFSIPVEITKVPPGLVVMNSPEPVRFKIRAPKDKWAGIRTASFRASVDLSRQGPGIQAVPVMSEVSDPQVKVLEVVPATVSVRLEEIQERTLPVKVNLVGNVPFGYVYRAPKVEPEVVVASGPASVLQGVQTASVEVRLEGITVEIDSAFHPVPADSTGSPVRNVQLSPQTVNVRLPVDQQVSYKQVGIRPSATGNVASGYWIESVTADPSSVTVVGDPKVLAGINFLETEPLNLGGSSTSVVQDLKIAVPQGISLVQQQTTRVRVTVSALQTSQVVRLAPQVINLDPKLQVIGAPSYLEVALQGPAPIMQGMRLDTVMVTLDASGLGEGVHSVQATVSAPPALSVVSVSPQTVDLALAPAATSTPVPPTGVARPPGQPLGTQTPTTTR